LIAYSKRFEFWLNSWVLIQQNKFMQNTFFHSNVSQVY
jgi:hypothetical protein